MGTPNFAVSVGVPDDWADHEELLSSIYGFQHRPCSALQSIPSIQGFCRLINDFISNLLAKAQLPSVLHSLSLSELQVLNTAAKLLSSSVPNSREFPKSGCALAWFPEYACALIGLRIPKEDEDEDIRASDDVNLMLLGLDSWEFRIHSIAQGKMEHTASCENSTILHAGVVAATDMSKIHNQLIALLSNAQKRTGEQRTAAVNVQGHQKTPAFLHAVLMDALEVVQAESAAAKEESAPRKVNIPEEGKNPPRGGFTDVGLHTGGLYRDTSWPLVQQVFKALLTEVLGAKLPEDSSPEVLFDRAMAYFHLWMVKRQSSLIGTGSATPLNIDIAMKMLQKSAETSAQLAHQGYDMAHFAAQCTEIRKKLDSITNLRAVAAANTYTLPELNTNPLPFHLANHKLPSGIVPPLHPAPETEANQEAAIQSTHQNINRLPVAEADYTIGEILQILQKRKARIKSDGTTASIYLCMVENVLYKMAVAGLYQSMAMSEQEISDLVDLVDIYRETLKDYMDKPASQVRLKVELHSREVLVAHVAFCLIHSATAAAHPILLNYGVGLHWEALKHLVLSDRLASDAVLAVAGYLRRHTNPRPVFTLADQTHTFHLAKEISNASLDIMRIWSEETAAAEMRVAAHWKEVDKHKEQVQKLRQQKRKDEEALRKVKEDLQEFEEEFYAFTYHERAHMVPDLRVKRQAVASAEAQLSSTREQINYWLQPPTPVIQPLPQHRDTAMQWLFFLYMPFRFHHLSRMTCLAQTLLIPGIPLESISFRTRITNHYNRYQIMNYSAGITPRECKEVNVYLTSGSEVPDAKKIGPNSVDLYANCDTDGVWYPDAFTIALGWQGSVSPGSALNISYNPFMSISDKALVEYFTPKLVSEGAKLQWAFPMYGVDEIGEYRGNKAIAMQHIRPHWISKPGWLDFGSLRAFPLLQIRRLCVALRARSLPLGNPTVQLLIRQALYHVGDLTNEDTPAFAWRAEWDSTVSDLLPTLHHEMSALADELAQTPRSFDSVIILGEIAAFFADWYTPFLDLSRRFAVMAMGWADDLEELVADAGAENANHIRAKQSLLRMTALICHMNGELCVSDAIRMVKLAVLINYGRVFEEFEGDDDPLRQQIAELHLRCQHVMQKRSTELMVLTEYSNLLTEAVQLVFNRAPDDLEWEMYGQQSYFKDSEKFLSLGYYVAEGSDNHVYGINILDGTVLLDGRPHKRLPAQIVDHPLYRRTFGQWSFEVAGQGVYKTARPVAGRFYEFYIDKKENLVVLEIDERGKKLQLLDVYGVEAPCGQWGSKLPVRLRQLYSHWICREEQVIVLRPINFRQHDTHFILHWDGGTTAPDPVFFRMGSLKLEDNAGSGAEAMEVEQPEAAANVVDYSCRRVPSHLCSLHWEDLLLKHSEELTDKLVLYSSEITRVLSKFEREEFIHCYANSSGAAASCSSQHRIMLIELPRYGLEFEISDGYLQSLDYRGYRLARCQQLVAPIVPGFTLPDFQQYLILTPFATGITRPTSTLVLIPSGHVLQHNQKAGLGQAGVRIDIDGNSRTHLEVHAYEIHQRFGHLCAKGLLPRLQLAALYAATSSLLPEPGLRMTGAEAAMQLVRQCWTNRPLNALEVAQLQNIVYLGRHLAPALPLLAYELQISSNQLNDLHFPYGLSEVEKGNLPQPLATDDATAYLQDSNAANPRLKLTAAEEQRVLHRCLGSKSSAMWLRLRQFEPHEVPPCPIGPFGISFMEQALLGLVKSKDQQNTDPNSSDSKPYPLSTVGETPLEDEMHAELKASWDAFHSSAVDLEVSTEAEEAVLDMREKVEKMKKEVENYLEEHLVVSVGRNQGCHGVGFDLYRQAGIALSPGPLDYMKLSLEPQTAKIFNPFLSDRSVEMLKEGSRRWLQLCVLLGRLDRIAMLLERKNSAEESIGREALLIQELQVHRTWDIDLHPEWLVFEAEGMLQIRPAQYLVARHLIDHPGAIVQLNMGEGKTRVIMPMLVLHWTKKRDAVVRLNLLPALLDEAYGYLHTHLCASVLARKLFVLPFQRDIILNNENLRAMRAALNHCRKEGGVLLVAPEQRLSLLLKRQELWEQGDKELYGALDKIIKEVSYIDLLDESDELLHHRFQLVYAWGSRTGLHSLYNRARAAQALLQILSSQAQQGKGSIGVALQNESSVVAVAAGAVETTPGSFCGLRLLPGDALQAVLPMLHKELAEALFEAPPYEMRWMKGHRLKKLLIELITDPLVDATALLARKQYAALTEKERCDILALRGLLGCQLMAHALQMRHRVDYGVSRLPSARRRLAVPFRAAHTPSERSEYAQPDSAMVLSILAYYSDGLSLEELLEALKVLLGLGMSAQQSHYGEWLSAAGIDRVPEALNNVRKIDTSNRIQMDQMHAFFSHNMATINFWLNHCVFPIEMQQYPKKLLSSAWHLAENRQVVGFSGTNDNHRLLPLQVKLNVLEAGELHATNGKMLHIILEEGPEYHTLESAESVEVWQQVLELAISRGMHALLDAGALLAGVSNRDAAAFLVQYLVQHPDVRNSNDFQGVCYFDTALKCWCMTEVLTGRRTPHSSSRISEQNAFTIYDEARCRGADLKLRQSAVGLLTLGLNCGKDKLMQAAGRLRQLGRGQKLSFVGRREITDRIIAVNNVSPGVQLTSKHVLQWVMHNTVQATLGGLLEWTKQGFYFAEAKNAPQNALKDEILQLEDLYGSSRMPQPVPRLIDALAESRAGKSANLAPEMHEMLEIIREKGVRYGIGHTVVAQSGLNEEIERELEREEEDEEEVEKEIARMSPSREELWDYSQILAKNPMNALHLKPGVISLSNVARLKLQPSSLTLIPWSNDVWCTRNFSSTVADAGDCLNEYLRPLDAVLLVPLPANQTYQLVFLSEREANGALQVLLEERNNKRATAEGVMFLHLSYAAEACVESMAPRLAVDRRTELERSAKLQNCLPQMVTGMLFNGETTYVEPRGRRWDEVSKLPVLQQLQALVHSRWEAAEALVGMRGKQAFFSRSQLELACGAKDGAAGLESPRKHAAGGVPPGSPLKKAKHCSSGDPSGEEQVESFQSISSLPEYSSKSVEEMRWETYQEKKKEKDRAA